MGPRVLVVDDDGDIRDALALILTEEGFDVAQAADGLEALAEIGRKIPALVLLDLMMPVLDGWKTLQIIRKTPAYADLPVVVFSAVMAEGCRDYLQKPIPLDRLMVLLESVRTKTLRAKPPSNRPPSS